VAWACLHYSDVDNHRAFELVTCLLRVPCVWQLRCHGGVGRSPAVTAHHPVVRARHLRIRRRYATHVAALAAVLFD
jgi:hypothetical protein